MRGRPADVGQKYAPRAEAGSQYASRAEAGLKHASRTEVGLPKHASRAEARQKYAPRAEVGLLKHASRAEAGRDGKGILPDYSVYRLSGKELAKYLAVYALLDGCISYLFFCSWIAFVVLLPGAFLFLEEQRRTLQAKRAREMTRQFLDGIRMIEASLQAGYSVENALREALRELRKMYEPDAFIVREFRFMETQIGMSRTMEELFADFGKRCAIEDIQSFAEVFLTAKRSGGDLLTIIRNTASCIRQKQETMLEIETCLSGKVMEQNIMSLIPLLILSYIKLSSPEFLEAMYGNVTGTTVMTICFAVYVVAYFWGRKIVQIEV